MIAPTAGLPPGFRKEERGFGGEHRVRSQPRLTIRPVSNFLCLQAQTRRSCGIGDFWKRFT
jgi:hypothetical protein